MLGGPQCSKRRCPVRYFDLTTPDFLRSAETTPRPGQSHDRPLTSRPSRVGVPHSLLNGKTPRGCQRSGPISARGAAPPLASAATAERTGRQAGPPPPSPHNLGSPSPRSSTWIPTDPKI